MKICTLPGSKLIILAAAFFICFSHAADVSAADREKKYGRFVFAEYEIPASTIAKYAAFNPSKANKGESAVVNVLLADTIDWQGPVFKGEPTNNPYTISVTVLGTARQDGDVSTMWQAGWNIEDRINGPKTRLTPLPGLAMSGVKAGQTLTLTGASAPISFSEAKDANVVLGLVNARNLDVHSVKVKVWTGLSKTTWLEALGAFRWLLVPLMMLGLMWWFRRT